MLKAFHPPCPSIGCCFLKGRHTDISEQIHGLDEPLNASACKLTQLIKNKYDFPKSCLWLFAKRTILFSFFSFLIFCFVFVILGSCSWLSGSWFLVCPAGETINSCRHGRAGWGWQWERASRGSSTGRQVSFWKETGRLSPDAEYAGAERH